jgi:hypothetical protein
MLSYSPIVVLYLHQELLPDVPEVSSVYLPVGGVIMPEGSGTSTQEYNPSHSSMQLAYPIAKSYILICQIYLRYRNRTLQNRCQWLIHLVVVVPLLDR